VSVSQFQAALPLVEFEEEAPSYLNDQLITYIGNKRALLGSIESAVSRVEDRLGRRLHCLDAFAGSGAVSRMLKRHSEHLIVNDLEPYAQVLAECYLPNRQDVPHQRIADLVDRFNSIVDSRPSRQGFIERLYAPQDEDAIQPGERVFYTRDNARRLDQYAELIAEVDPDLRPFLLGPLLSAASVHANTAGVFKGFYKDKATGVGKYGGAGQDALSRIKGRIRLRPPVTSNYTSTLAIHRGHANDVVRRLPEVDLAYFDPPYNQHPYGSNYFMLNLLVNYQEPAAVSPVSGIPVDWQRSPYNVKKSSLPLVTDLVANTAAKFLLVSFNDEGYIPPAKMLETLRAAGEVTEFQFAYNAFRGSRNLSGRSTHVTEHLYLVEKK
jgi:adenine-specific DNA-methyltransferase